MRLRTVILREVHVHDRNLWECPNQVMEPPLTLGPQCRWDRTEGMYHMHTRGKAKKRPHTKERTYIQISKKKKSCLIAIDIIQGQALTGKDSRLRHSS